MMAFARIVSRLSRVSSKHGADWGGEPEGEGGGEGDSSGGNLAGGCCPSPPSDRAGLGERGSALQKSLCRRYATNENVDREMGVSCTWAGTRRWPAVRWQSYVGNAVGSSA